MVPFRKPPEFRRNLQLHNPSSHGVIGEPCTAPHVRHPRRNHDQIASLKGFDCLAHDADAIAPRDPCELDVIVSMQGAGKCGELQVKYAHSSCRRGRD